MNAAISANVAKDIASSTIAAASKASVIRAVDSATKISVVHVERIVDEMRKAGRIPY